MGTLMKNRQVVGGTPVVDTALDSQSTDVVQNKVVAEAITTINSKLQQKTSVVFGAAFTNGIAIKDIEWLSHDHNTTLAQELCTIPENIARLFYSARAYDGYVEVYARDLDGNAYNGYKTIIVYITD